MGIFAFHTGATTIPTLPAGWTSLFTATPTSTGGRLGVKIATATNDASGTWTNATALTCVVWTSTAVAAGGYLTWGGGFTGSSGTTTTITYPAVTFFNANASSWLAAFAGSRSTTNSLTTHIPTGLATIASADLINTCEVNAFDSNGTISSWSSTNTTVTTGTGWVTAMLEIVEVPPVTIPSNIVQHLTWAVNSTAASGEKGNNYVLPFLSTTLSNNTVFMVLGYPNTATLSTITDNSGSNTWSTTPNVTHAGGTMTYSQFEVDNAAPLSKITVNFTGLIQPLVAWLVEVYNVTGFDNGTGATTAGSATTPKILSAGNFTPLHNNDLVFSYFGVDFTASGVNISQWDKQNNANALDMDNVWTQGQGYPKASQVVAQGTAAAITPQIQANHTGSTDPYIGLTFALKTGTQGTAPPAFRALGFQGVCNSTAVASQPMQIVCNGNAYTLAMFGGFTPVPTDSDAVSWTVNGSTSNQILTRQNAGANDVRRLTIAQSTNLGGAWGGYLIDWVGADATAIHDFTSVNSTSVTNGALSISGQVSITPTVLGATLDWMTNGIGPTSAFTVPSGNFYLFPVYTGQGDSGQMALGNAIAVYYQTGLSNQNWTATLASTSVSSASYNSGTGVVTVALAAPFDTAFTGNDIFITFTGTGSFASLNGHQVVATDSGDGINFTFNGTTGLTLTLTGGTITQYNISVQSAALTIKAGAAAAAPITKPYIINQAVKRASFW